MNGSGLKRKVAKDGWLLFIKFTLVELLVAISIIALLAALLFPALGAARAMGKGIACCSNLKQLGLVMSLYSSDYDGWLPVSNYYSDPSAFGWKRYLAPYFVNGYDPSGSIHQSWSHTGILKCPAWKIDLESGYSGGYGWSVRLGNKDGGSYPRRNIGRIARHAETIAIGDCTNDPSALVTSVINPPLFYGVEWNLVNPKHRRGFNNLWLDGHADWQSREFLLRGQPGGADESGPVPLPGVYYYWVKTQ